MRALLYDIHGNLPALEAVIADAQSAGVDEFVFGGDYALAGAFPEECVKRIEGLSGAWIRGNTDRWLEDPSDTPDDDLLRRQIEYCRGELGGRRVELLFNLPPSVSLDGALVCHASPHDDMLTFMTEPTDADHELLANTEEAVVFFGHSHIQFQREAEGGRLLVNPGSVGLPFDGDRRAAYALWQGGRAVELRRVEYDSDGYAASVRDRMAEALGPGVETIVRRIQQAAFVAIERGQMKLSAVLLNCTLKKSPEVSNTEALMDIVIGHLESLDVECELIRPVDYRIPFGVVSDMGDGDERPRILARIEAADILIIGTSIWFGVRNSVCQDGDRAPRRGDLRCRATQRRRAADVDVYKLARSAGLVAVGDSSGTSRERLPSATRQPERHVRDRCPRTSAISARSSAPPQLLDRLDVVGDAGRGRRA